MCPARVRFLFPLDHTRISIIYLRFSFGVGRRPPLVVSSSETLFIEAPFPPKHNRYQIIRSHFFLKESTRRTAMISPMSLPQHLNVKKKIKQRKKKQFKPRFYFGRRRCGW